MFLKTLLTSFTLVSHFAFSSHWALDALEKTGLKFTFATTPTINILKTAHVTHLDGGFSQFIYPSTVLLTLEQTQNHEGEVRMDCALFAQVASLILEKSDTVGLMRGPFAPEDLAPLFSKRLAYLAPSPGASSILSELNTHNKGQWLLDVGEGMWLGLGDHNPQVLTPVDWAQQRYNGLMSDMEAGSHSQDEGIKSQAQAIKFLHKAWQLTHWNLVNSNGNLLPVSIQNPVEPGDSEEEPLDSGGPIFIQPPNAQLLGISTDMTQTWEPAEGETAEIPHSTIFSSLKKFFVNPLEKTIQE